MTTPLWVRCIVVNLTFKARLPENQAYPLALNTIGDHLRKVRLDRNMSQPEVAKVIKVSTDTITGWELNRNTPTPKYVKKIIEFLGYSPFVSEKATLNEQLYYTRLTLGLTQKQIAKQIGCNETTIRMIELNQGKAGVKIRYMLETFLIKNPIN
jgi:transcriptional regulator with XRE-family HTH domain